MEKHSRSYAPSVGGVKPKSRRTGGRIAARALEVRHSARQTRSRRESSAPGRCEGACMNRFTIAAPVFALVFVAGFTFAQTPPPKPAMPKGPGAFGGLPEQSRTDANRIHDELVAQKILLRGETSFQPVSD